MNACLPTKLPTDHDRKGQDGAEKVMAIVPMLAKMSCPIYVQMWRWRWWWGQAWQMRSSHEWSNWPDPVNRSVWLDWLFVRWQFVLYWTKVQRITHRIVIDGIPLTVVVVVVVDNCPSATVPVRVATNGGSFFFSGIKRSTNKWQLDCHLSVQTVASSSDGDGQIRIDTHHFYSLQQA